MDDSLLSLEQELKADPTNQELQARYETLLLRENQQKRIKEIFQFKFLCPQKWEDLKSKTPEGEYLDSSEGFCEKCERKVYFASDLKAFQEHALNNHCVAVHEPKIESVFEDLIHRFAGKPQKSPAPPCILKTDYDPTRQILLGMPSFSPPPPQEEREYRV